VKRENDKRSHEISQKHKKFVEEMVTYKGNLEGGIPIMKGTTQVRGDFFNEQKGVLNRVGV